MKAFRQAFSIVALIGFSFAAGVFLSYYAKPNDPNSRVLHGYTPVPKWIIGEWRADRPPTTDDKLPTRLQISGDWDYQSGIWGNARSSALGTFRIEGNTLILDAKLFAQSPEISGGRGPLKIRMDKPGDALYLPDGTHLVRWDTGDKWIVPRER